MMDIQKIRELIPATRNSIYMNTGAGGPMPLPVIEAISSSMELEHRNGPYTPPVWTDRKTLIPSVRGKAASLIGAQENEVALTDNTSSGINIVANCIDWGQGDQVIITDAEHPGGYLPWFNLKRLKGIETVVVPLGDSDERFLADLEGAVTGRCRLICLSHVAWCLGRRLPIAAVAEIAGRKGVPCIVDGAQAVGQMAVNVKELGVDFYSFPGHKWLMGPMGTGVLYASPEAVKKVRFTSAGFYSGPSYDLSRAEFTPYEDSRRFEIATRSSLLLSGLGAALDFITGVGVNEIEGIIREKATDLIHYLSGLEKITLHSTLDERGGAQSGLVSFVIEGMDPEEVVKELWSRGNIAGRWVPDPKAVRLSVNFFNTREELNKVKEVIAQIAAS
jgi:L-cysteine/cystine lyase